MAVTEPKTKGRKMRRVELRLPDQTAKLLNIMAAARDTNISILADEILIRALMTMAGDGASLAS